MSKKSQVTVDLNKPILNLKGKPNEKEDTYGDVIADYLSAKRTGNARKQWQWALKLGNREPLVLDRVDFDEFKKMIDNEQEMLATIIQGPVMEMLVEMEKTADEADKAGDNTSGT